MHVDRHRLGAAPVGRQLSRLRTLMAAVVMGWCVAAAGAQTPAPAGDAPPRTDAPVVRAWLDRADALMATGRAADAGRLLDEAPDEVGRAIVQARLAARAGRYRQAIETLRPALTRDPLGDAALDAALLLQRLGESREANAIFTDLVGAANDEEGHSLLRAARAAHALRQHQLANQLFRDASAALDGAPAVETAWGELFLDASEEPEAIRSFERVIAARDDDVPARLGLARALSTLNPPGAAEQALRALAIEPSAWEAHVILADLALDRRRVDEARAAVAAAVALNPFASEVLSLRAALAAVEGRVADLEDAVDAARALNPRDGRPYRTASEHVAGHYRFEEAVALARRAVDVNGDDPASRAALGLHLMRTGEEEAARPELEFAFARDPFNRVTYNLLQLLDTLDAFESVRDGVFHFKFHPEEAAVLRELAVPLARDAFASMTARYEFTPPSPVLIEIFPKHDDFAVRTLGLPGMVGALGACFGRVVTLDSPRARPPGAFHWGATLWHELAHVITLQLSNQRVPRWLSEGLSVYEERRARPAWGRESELELVRRLDDGGAVPLESLNDAFSDPRRIVLAYQQASLVAEFLVERFGQPAIVRMLRAYAEGLDDPAVFARELKRDTATLQGEFDAFVDERYGAIRRALRVPEGVSIETRDAKALTALAASHPGSYPVQVAAAMALMAAGDAQAATPYLERALALVPIVTGADAPRMLLVANLIASGDRARAAGLLEEEVSLQNTALDAARTLASVSEALGDTRRLALAHERVSEVQPYQAASHLVLGRLALAAGDAEAALPRLRLALTIGPDDRVAARTDYADALLRTGDRPGAKAELLAALEGAPLYERAQDLLLSVVDAPRRREVRP